MKKGRKIIFSFLAALLALALVSLAALPAGAAFNSLLEEIPGLTGVSEILLLQSLDDGSTLFSKNETKRVAPASLTKLTVAILVMENCADVNVPVTAKAESIRMFDGTNSSNAGIKPGEILTVEQLLYCLLLPSANEAAAILADFIAGDVPSFVSMMNAFVKKLGCKDTQFMNPHGLDQEGHYTTAADVALVLRYALSRDFKGNTLFEKIVASRTFEIQQTNKSQKRTLFNTNKMLNPGIPDYYSKDVTGIKTGTTDHAGDCIAAKASRNGYNYLCIVMRGQKVNVDGDAAMENTAFVDCKALLDWTFDHIRLRQVTTPEKVVGEVPVALARSTDHVQIVPKETLSALVPEEISSGSFLVEPIPGTVPEGLEATVKKGEVICKGQVKYAGEVFATVDLVAAETVNRSASMYLISLAQQAVKHPIAKLLLIAVLLVAGIYLTVLWLQARKKRQQKQMRVLPDISVKSKKK
ncbi:MAG: D-alanyl-D-alanine carboxypeptidase [Oscillospiraceae bacterium]|jgi:D-alanyl-D-alanine carboxypeptidase (penicillin-binding protein 5/6)|nr:D-alanyl-D-alanine carboxypeptidase [Oscillospiraceae bacterium]